MLFIVIGLIVASYAMIRTAGQLEDQAVTEQDEDIRRELMAAAKKRRTASSAMRWVGIALLLAIVIFLAVLFLSMS